MYEIEYRDKKSGEWKVRELYHFSQHEAESWTRTLARENGCLAKCYENKREGNERNLSRKHIHTDG